MNAVTPGAATLPAKTRPVRLPAGPAPTPIEKAAIILTAVGPELAAGFLKDLKEEDLQRFARTIARIGTVSQETLDAVIVEFLEALTSGGDVVGGANAARRLLGAVLDESDIARLLDGNDRSRLSVWDRLNLAPVGTLATYCATEHPQSVAVILSELKAETAAAVLERLDREFAQSIVLRLGRVPSLDARVNEAICGAIERDFLSVLQRNLSKRRPAELIAGLMNNISVEAREGFLGYLESRDADLALDVQRTMFTFDDIAVRIATRDVAAIIRDIPEEVLMPALKLGQMQGSDSVRFVLESVPRRLAERYVEDLEAMDEPSRKEGEAAQIEITKVILALAKAGTIKLMDRDAG